MIQRVRNPGFAVVALLLWLAPAAAQVELGDNLNMSLGGGVSFGYSGGFSSDTPISSHGLSFGGNAQLHGYYYDPRFISFDIQPYYNRSQSNSSFQSISDSSGFTGTVNFFSGSHFPGSVTYSKAYDTLGQFGIPDVSGLSTNGSGQTFAVVWSVLLPDKPTLTASFSTNSNSSSVYGTETNSESSIKNLRLRSDYKLAGFRLSGFFNRQWNDASFPVFLGDGEVLESTGRSNSFGISASRPLPLHGQWSASFSRSTFGNDYLAGSSGSTNDTLDTGVGFNLTRNLAVYSNATYYDNLLGTLQEQIVAAGGVAEDTIRTSSSKALLLRGDALYTVCRYLSLRASVTHQEAFFLGDSRGLTQFSGTANFNYSQKFLGSLRFSLSVVDSATQQGNTGTGILSNVNFSRKLHGWDIAANFGYSQNVQTLLIVYTTSSYNYGTHINRRFNNRAAWHGSFTGVHSGISQQAGSGSHSEIFSTGLSFRKFSANANYSQSSGISILTANGLVPVPGGVPLPLVPQAILYDGKSLGFGASVTPLRRLSITGAYSKAHSNAISPTLSSANSTAMLNAFMRWRTRKLYFDAGFTRFEQSISAAGTPPSVVNSYYFGISRWFSVF